MPRSSVVNVTQLRTVDRIRLDDPVGVLGQARVQEILQGLSLVFGLDGLADHGSGVH